MCVICRRRFPRDALIRYVLSPQGNTSIDPKKSALGRGLYLCSDPHCEVKFAKYRPGVKRRENKHA
ncbi:MAG: YlxR family protein [Desulfovibrio sp.]|nr:YlxR family protein [Desulfovibrio sp.]